VVKVHYDEGIALHIGPKPCVSIREDAGEASAGEHIGQPWSRENKIIPGADVFRITEGKRDGSVMRAPARPGVVEDPGRCGSSLPGSREISGLACGGTPQVRSGKARSRSR
jgi:hypothetical protein